MFITDDVIYERHGEYIRNVSPYFIDRCLDGDNGGRDFDAIVHDLQHGYDGGMSLPALVQRFVGPDAKVTQDTVLAAIRTAFTQMYEGESTRIDVLYTAFYPDVRDMFDMFIACHPKFDTKFRSYLPDTYKLDKDQYGNWIITVTGTQESIMYSDGEYVLVESEDIVDDLSWVKTARNAVRMFKGCTPQAAGFTSAPAIGVARDDFLVALRSAINDQISAYRRKHKVAHGGTYVDEVDGKRLAPLDSHVDHYPISFARLVDMWLAEQQYGFEDIVTEATVGEFNGVVMSNDTQRRSWQDFHRDHAVLRIVSKERNLSSRHY